MTEHLVTLSIRSNVDPARIVPVLRGHISSTIECADGAMLLCEIKSITDADALAIPMIDDCPLPPSVEIERLKRSVAELRLGRPVQSPQQTDVAALVESLRAENDALAEANQTLISELSKMGLPVKPILQGQPAHDSQVFWGEGV